MLINFGRGVGAIGLVWLRSGVFQFEHRRDIEYPHYSVIYTQCNTFIMQREHARSGSLMHKGS